MYPIFAAKALVVFFGMYYNDALPRPFRLLVYHAFIALFIELTGLWLTKVGITNVVLFNVFNMIDVWLIAGVVHTLLDNKKYKKFTRICLPLLSLLWLYKMYDHGADRYLSKHMIIYSLFLMVIFFRLMYENSTSGVANLFRRPVFIVCVALMVDYGCSIPLFGTLNYFIETDVVMAKNLLYIGHVVNTLRYVLIAIAFYLYAHQANRGYVGQ